MVLRRALQGLVPRLASANTQAVAALCGSSNSLCLSGLPAVTNPDTCLVGALPSKTRLHSYATGTVQVIKDPSQLPPCEKLSISPSPYIKYDEHTHKRFPPGKDDKAFAYFVLTGGRFLYASAVRLAALKVLMSLSAAADTLAMASLEVDLSNIEEGQTVTVKWRGKPVFIRHRTDEEIQAANSTPLSELRDPQPDTDRATDPKYLIVVGVCTHLGCVPIAGAGDYDGWFCPCHGSHYDISGRIRKGPAPYNLEVPEYRFIEDGKVIVG